MKKEIQGETAMEELQEKTLTTDSGTDRRGALLVLFAS
jgi:hypothetical protein